MRISVTWHAPTRLLRPMSRLHEHFDLNVINTLGTKLPVDVIDFDGNRLARRRSGRELRVPKRRGRGGDVE